MALEVPEDVPEGGEQDPPVSTNPYDKIVADQVGKSAARAPLSRSFYVADQIRPEDAQKALEISKTSKLPASMILRNIQNGVKQEPPTPTSVYDKILDETPRLGEWSKNPINRAAVKDKGDYEKLQDVEKLIQGATTKATPYTDAEIMKGAVMAAHARAERASNGSRYVPNLSSGELEDLGADIPAEHFYQDFLQEEIKSRLAENTFLKNPDKVGFGEAITEKARTNPVFLVPIYNQIPGLWEKWGLNRAKDRIAEDQGTPEDFDLVDRSERMEAAGQKREVSALGHLGEFAASTPAFLGDLAFAGPVARAAGVGAKVAVTGLLGGLARKSVGFAVNLGTTAAISEGVKTLAGTVARQTPAGEASVDEAGNFHYKINSDKGEPLVLSFGKESLSTLFDIAGTKLPIGPLYKALSGEVGEVAAKGIASRVMHIGVEGLKEAFTGLSINEGTKLAKALTKVGPEYHFSVDEALGQGAGFGLMGMIHGFQAKTADSTVRTLTGVHDLIDQMEAAKKAPHVIESALDAITEKAPLFLPVKDVQTFYQSKGLDPRAEMEKVLGDPAKYDQAIDSDYIRIPASRYLMTIDRDPEASKFFQGKVKRDPMDASREELDAAIKDAQATAKKPGEGPPTPAGQSTPDQQFDESGAQVGRFIQGRMKELGYGREAEAYGKVWEERYKARAERRGLGELPGELFDKEQVGIFKREGPGGEAPEGEAQYVKVLEQNGQPHIERVPGATPAEGAQHAGEMFPDATIEPMTPEEVKSMLSDAMGGGTREFMQGAGEKSPRLSALHNMTEENLSFADQLGGLAVPSIAVVPEKTPVRNYGSITLIGRKGHGDPSKVPVYDADAYSPTFPSPEYRKVPMKTAQPVVNEFKDAAKRFSEPSIVDTIWDNAVNTPNPDRTISDMLRNPAVQAKFLESKGDRIEPVTKVVRAEDTQAPFVESPAFKKFVEEGKYKQQSPNSDPEGYKEFSRMVEKAINEYADTLPKDVREDFREAYKEQFIDPDTGEVYFGRTQRIDHAMENIGEAKVEREETRKLLETKLKGKESEFKSWVEGKILPMYEAPQLTVGGRKVPYDLDGIVERMSGRVRGQEKNLTFGEGAARAAASKRFSDLEQMRRAAGENIQDEATITKSREHAKTLMEEYRDAVLRHSGDMSTWDALDSSMRAMAKWAKTGAKGESQMRAALASEGFHDVSEGAITKAVEAGRAWLKAPVPYFEAKPQRAVALSEFAGAVIPKNATAETRRILNDNGIAYREYADAHNETQRFQAVSELRGQLARAGQDVLFQPQDGAPPRGSIEFGPQGSDINLFRQANRSTFLHESGHKWFDELITDATTEGTSEQLRKDLDTVLKWMGSDATALQGGKEIRKTLTEQQQEKWARAVEAYLMKGEAPSAELRGVFYRFANWLKGIYKSLTGLEQEAGQKLDISPEVRDVMDRLLASDQQIEEAKSSENVQSILSSADWVPAADKEQISSALAGVDRQAKEELNQKLMAEVHQEESEQYAREREAMKGPIAAEVDQRPEQVALANLERGTRPDGTPLGSEDLPAIKISRKATLDAYDGKPEALGGLPRRIFAKEGVTPDEAAEYFGFSSGDELLASLRKLYEPQTPEAREIQTKLEGLEMQRKLLLAEKQPLEAQTEEATKNLKAGRKTLANKLERAIRDAERSAIEPINEILKDIKDRGGIEPSEPTEDLPDAFRGRKGKGVSSDIIAQELYDRGKIDSPDSDALYKKLTEWQKNAKESRERQADSPKEARRLASERVSSSIEDLISNSTEQERLRVQLARLQSEEAAFKREHQVNQRKALIDRLADERMKAEHPDMMTDGTLPEEAVKSVYNAQRAKLMARELELLVEHKMPANKKMLEALAKRGGFSELMKAQAEERLSGMKYREITPNLFRVAARKAGNEWAKEYNAGNWKGAFDAKRKELLNHELFRASVKVKEAIDSGREYMTKFSDDAVRARIGKAGGDYLDQIDDLTARFGFQQISRRESARRESLRTWYDGQVRLAQAGEGYMPDIPPHVLDEAFKTNYKDMTYQEFQDVVDAAKNIEHLAGLKNSLLASVDKRDYHERVDAGVDSIVANSPGPRKVSLEPRLPGYELKKRGAAGFFASLRKMASLVREMDGFKDGGVMWDLIVRPANRAGNREATMQAKGAEALSKLYDVYSPKEQLAMYRKEYIPEIKDSLSGWGRIMVALNSGNEGNLQRLKDGYHWTDEQIKAILDRLTEKDWALVKGIADHIETYWPEIRDLNKRVTGLEPEKVEPKPFMTKYGEMPGWYFPIKYEPILSPAAGEHAAVDEAKPSLMGATIMATTKSGHRQARMDHVERPLRLDPGVISDHLNQVIHDLTHFEFVVDTNRLLKSPKLQKALIDHYGDQNFVQMKDWIKDIAVGIAPAKTQGERLLNWIRQGAVVSRLALNLNNVLTFQTGITQGMQRIGPEWVAKGWAQIGGDAMRMENAFEKIRNKSEFMANRWRTMLREVSEVTGSMTKKSRVELLADMGLDAVSGGRVNVEDLQHTFYMFLAKTYEMQDGPVWIGAYEKAMAEHPVESEHSPEDRDRMEKRAIDMADQAVIDSFGGGQIKDLSQTQRAGPAWKAFTAFGAWANTTLQRNVEAGTRWKNAPTTIGSTLKLGSDLALLNILPAAAATAIGYALSNNEKDKKGVVGDFWADQAAQFMNQIPGVSQFTPALHGQDYEGPGGLELFQTGNRLLKSSIEAVEKRDIKKIDVKAANQTAGVLFHYPSVFVQRAGQALIETKHGAGEALKVFLGGRPRK